MRRSAILHTLLPALILLAGAGCRKNDLQPGVNTISVVVKTSLADNLKDYTFPALKVKVTLRNGVTGTELYMEPDKDGIALFDNVSAGQYDVIASTSIDRATYENITGLPAHGELIPLNANLASIQLNSKTKNVLDLKMEMGIIGQWVIKQIYYAGSHTTNGAVNRDQFIEIYNNSNEVLYADSLYFGQLAGNNTGFNSTDMSKGYYVDDATDAQYKQFNWAKSIGMQPATAAAYKDYVYMKSLFRIPGTGKQYPVQPGQSIVIAANAINHKAPYVDNSGKPYNVKNPELTIDLRGADFEVFLGSYITNNLASDINNSNVPDVLVIEPAFRDLVLDATGRDAMVIFRSDKAIPLYGDVAGAKGFGLYPDPTVKVIDETTNVFYQIPTNIIIDAVQMQSPSATSSQRVARKLQNMLDAGAINVPDGSYSSQSIIRKTARVVNGRKILMDTNNSGVDFDFLPMATPKGFKN